MKKFRASHRKYVALAMHIRIKTPGRMSDLKLRWAMFYADMTAYRELGKPITGVAWIKTKNGPMPRFV